MAPTRPVPIVRMVEGERQFALVRWGLIPAWVKDPKGFALLINARAESVNDKPSFQNAMKRRRCLFPADGFYEWKAHGNSKRPYLARPTAGGPIAFAGLWETWFGPNGEELDTAAIVTTEANAAMAAVHHRAPVIVPPEQFDFWLDCKNLDEHMAAELLAPAPEGSMELYEVSPAVNRVANDAPALHKPYNADAVETPAETPKPAPRKRQTLDNGQGSLF